MKFPTTPHLLWLGTTAARADKVLAREEAQMFLSQPVVVEEKVDGANLGLSFDAHGNLIAQNRGNVLQRGINDQFAPLWAWLSERETRLFDALEDCMILFGEWCYARHSIHYTRLPDYFLAFDVFDRREQCFLSSVKRDEICDELKLTIVPIVGSGLFSLSEIPCLIGQSSFYDGPMEGVYLRQENSSFLIHRDKVVRAEFTQLMDEHWMNQPMTANRLLPNLKATEKSHLPSPSPSD